MPLSFSRSSVPHQLCLFYSVHPYRSCIYHPHDFMNIVFHLTSFVFYHVVLSNNTLGYEGCGRHALKDFMSLDSTLAVSNVHEQGLHLYQIRLYSTKHKYATKPTCVKKDEVVIVRMTRSPHRGTVQMSKILKERMVKEVY